MLWIPWRVTVRFWKSGGPRFTQLEQLLAESQHLALRRTILDSPWLAATTLNQRFAATWGFSVAFQRSGLARVGAEFPAFVPYLEKVVEADYNAFFLNPLVIFRGGQVMPHVDCSLRSYTAPLEPPCPGKVSVYYVQVPPQFVGGALVLSQGGRQMAEIQPRENLLVQFDGALMHHVVPFEGQGEPDLERSRISLVCEHYRLPEELLIRIPEFHLESTRGFQDFLNFALEAQRSGKEA